MVFDPQIYTNYVFFKGMNYKISRGEFETMTVYFAQYELSPAQR